MLTACSLILDASSFYKEIKFLNSVASILPVSTICFTSLVYSLRPQAQHELYVAAGKGQYSSLLNFNILRLYLGIFFPMIQCRLIITWYIPRLSSTEILTQQAQRGHFQQLPLWILMRVIHGTKGEILVCPFVNFTYPPKTYIPFVTHEDFRGNLGGSVG